MLTPSSEIIQLLSTANKGIGLEIARQLGKQSCTVLVGARDAQRGHEAIRAIIDRYLGSRRRAGQGFLSLPTTPHEEALARTRCGVPRRLFCAGRDDLVQDIDAVLANYFSTSFAAPHLLGDQRGRFEADVRTALKACFPSGLFWDWPGDTAILLAGKPG